MEYIFYRRIESFAHSWFLFTNINSIADFSFFFIKKEGLFEAYFFVLLKISDVIYFKVNFALHFALGSTLPDHHKLAENKSDWIKKLKKILSKMFQIKIYY